MKICIFGLGGVGAYLASRFTQHNVSTSCIVRGAHKEAIEKNGLKYILHDKTEIVTHPYQLESVASKLDIADVAFVCIKGTNIKESAQTLKPVVKEGTIIVPVLNGVAASRILQEEFPSARVLNCCTYITSMITNPGEVTQVGPFAEFNIGQGPKPIDEKEIEDLVDLMIRCEIDAHYAEDILAKMWTKYIMFSAYSASGTYFNANCGHLTKDPEKKEVLLKLLNENAAVAKAMNINLPSDIAEVTYNNMCKYDPNATTSLQRDMYTEGKGTEWELIQGEMVRYAQKAGVSNPTLEMIYNKFKR